MEASGHGRAWRGVFERCRPGWPRPCIRSPRPSCQDWRTTGYFGARAQVMSRVERKAMIQRDQPGPSLSGQCEILSISRSSFYFASRGESPASLALTVHGQHLHRAAVALAQIRGGYLHELTDGFKAERVIGEWIDFTIPRGLIQPTTAKRRRRPMAPGRTTTATGCDKQDFGDIIRQQNTP